MKRSGNIISISIVVFLFCSALAFAGGGREEKQNFSISRTYTGMADFDFLLVEEGKLEEAAEPIIIRSREEFDAFVEFRIPKKEMSKTNPAPDSDDPILDNPDIDFDKNMVVVAFSIDPNQFIGVEITGVKKKGERLVVTVEYDRPDPDAIYQKIINYGRYCAAVVPRFDGDIEFTEK